MGIVGKLVHLDSQCPTWGARVEGMTKTIFTTEFKTRLAALPDDEQLWLSNELYLMALALERRASRRKKRAARRSLFPNHWRN